MLNHDAAFAAVSNDHRPELFSAARSSDYQLRGTLDAYEVEELDGHELAHFFPTIILDETSRAELDPDGPSGV